MAQSSTTEINERAQFALIASAWGHKGSDDHLASMGRGLYNRYCLGDDYSKSAKDYGRMVELCEQLKNAKSNIGNGTSIFDTDKEIEQPEKESASPKIG